MMKLRKVLFISLILLIGWLVIWKIGEIRVIRENQKKIPQNNPSTSSGQAVEYAKVKQVVDGDTIKLESGETVRYIGVNTPEVYQYDEKTKRWEKINKCYSDEAMAKNKELVEGKVVRLEKETSEVDKFGRLLRDVWVEGVFINLELVKEGDAKMMIVPPDIKYQKEILAAEKEAREGNRGLWNECK